MSSAQAKVQKKPRAAPARHWCFTAHADTAYDQLKTIDLINSGVRYLVFQGEICPKTGKAHVQGYVEFYKKIRMNSVRQQLNGVQCHLEKRKGTRAQAAGYCQKKDSADPRRPVVELGKMETRQGHRSDIEQVADLILSNNCSEEDVALALPTQYLKMSTHIRRLINVRNRKKLNKHRKVDVHVLWGETRSGKTRRVFDTHSPEDVFKVRITESGKLWFDGYAGQPVLLLDEFYGQLRVNQLQELLDNYVSQWEIKGGFIVSNWNTIYITSNCHPAAWYSQWRSIPARVCESIEERINTITFMKRKVPRKGFGRFKSHKSIDGSDQVRPDIESSLDSESTSSLPEVPEESDGADIITPVTSGTGTTPVVQWKKSPLPCGGSKELKSGPLDQFICGNASGK